MLLYVTNILYKIIIELKIFIWYYNYYNFETENIRTRYVDTVSGIKSCLGNFKQNNAAGIRFILVLAANSAEYNFIRSLCGICCDVS